MKNCAVLLVLAGRPTDRARHERLRQAVMSTTAVLRDGEWQEIPRRDVVPGDIVRLFAGDLVPADGKLIQSKDLYVQQAALTGESLPVEKEIAPGEPATDQPEACTWSFLGTSVVSGSAIAEVTATGRADHLRRYRCTPRRPTGRERIRTRSAKVWPPHHASGLFSGFVSYFPEHRVAS